MKRGRERRCGARGRPAGSRARRMATVGSGARASA